VASAIAAFELVLLVLIALAFLGSAIADKTSGSIAQKVTAEAAPPAQEEPAAAKTTAEPTKRAKPAAELPRAETSVVVLNGNGIQGAAAEATEEIRRFEYLIAGTGNAPRTDFERSLVMYRPGYRGEAVRLARDLEIRRVAPLDGMASADLLGAQVALIVGSS
jgi:hypothetical protein